MKKLILALSVMVAMPGLAMARAASITDNPFDNHPPHFYERHAEGWYWYNDPEPEKEQEQEIKKPEPKPIVVEKSQTEEQPQPPKAFSAQWVREMLPKYMDRAWDDPTPENVEAYFLLQRFAMDRSQKFSQVAQSVVIGNPYLDETNRRPVANYGIPYVDRQAGQNLDDLVKKVANKAGFFFFFKSNCQYCEAQAPILKYLEKDGFDILAISIDGGQLQSAQFENTKMNSGQAEQLGVTATPALFMVDATGKFTALGQGLMSYTDLKSRILIVAAREGWITEEEINETRPIMNGNDPQHDLSERFPQMLEAQADERMFNMPNSREKQQFEKLVAMDGQKKEALMNEDGFIEPKTLLRLLNDDNRLSGEISEDE